MKFVLVGENNKKQEAVSCFEKKAIFANLKLWKHLILITLK